ncbi:hypothetical protein RND81_09G121900 [Saponaria officinalis]|uniref:Uncharacterized protein n=1 Tax=Saponaria officinalis TaxID=3572 RepID=A0AAW1ILZ4_SAPOF
MQNPLKSQHYQQYNASVLHHSSFYDGRDENSAMELGKNGVKNGSYDFSSFGNESYVVVRQECGEKGKTFGFVVRSLRSRGENERVTEFDDECSGGSLSGLSWGYERNENSNEKGIIGKRIENLGDMVKCLGDK